MSAAADIAPPPAAAGAPRVVPGLTRAYVRGLRNGLTRGGAAARRWRLAAVVGGLGFWLLVFFFARGGVAALRDFIPYADRVVLKGLDLMFLVLLGAMTYSSVLVALVHLYTSDDLRLLGALPASNRALYVAKWIEIAVVSAWAPVAFGAAMLAGAGAGFGVGWSYYPAAFLGLLVLASIPVSLAMGLTTLAVNVFPANRTRDVLVFSSLVILLAIFVALRTLRPERLVDPAQVRELSALLAGLQPPGAGTLPSSWMAGLIAPFLSSAAPAGWPSALLLVAGAAGAGLLGLLAFAPLFRRGVSQTLSSRGRTSARAPLLVRLTSRLTLGFPSAAAAVARKDLLQFGRDPSQWSQLLLLAALVVIYLFNVRIIPLDQMRTVGLERDTAADLFAVGNLLFVGFVLAAVALRFCFSGISLEGRAAWIVLTSPMGFGRLLAAKVVPGALLLVAFSAILTGGSLWILEPSRGVALVSLAGAAVMALALAALGVGIGALAPQFRAPNPARIAGSIGGLVFMVAGLGLVVVEVALLAYPAYLLGRADPASPLALLAGLALGALAVAVPGTASAMALLLGRRALESRRATP